MPDYQAVIQSEGENYRRVMCIRDLAADGHIPSGSPRVNECLGDLNAAPETGVNKDGATVRANEVKFREYRFKDSATCVEYKFWAAGTEPVRVS